MICCLWTRVHKQPIIALYFESETVLQFYNLDAWYAGKEVYYNDTITFFSTLRFAKLSCDNALQPCGLQHLATFRLGER